jgi:hypothetical protein
MAGIVWWTAERVAELRRLIEVERRTYSQVASILTRRYRRRLGAAGLRDVARRHGIRGQGGRPLTPSPPG